ncbi:hypothetical protein N1030_17565 [Desulfovibrio mangrovi]|uniref:hypothetical protein n=1 Tax=Desulfovibrio mangrovi TaxID=2976983 RepID=UPI002247385E|nr:hypothetical protein [Desulfovibrio mangrovi]UZP67381.1 hypothetical protein N1030_17565 [Desulfovibrio mangrovi]
MASVISICNKGLRYLGGEEILSLEQESRGARLCSQYYSEVRDELLEEHHWNFAARYIALASLPAAPLFGFARAYQLPADCLRVRRLRGNADFEVVENRVLYSDAYPAEAVVTVRVTDPARFPALFVEVLARKLAAELAVPLMNSSRLEQSMMTKYINALERAKAMDATEGAVDPDDTNEWVRARLW